MGSPACRRRSTIHHKTGGNDRNFFYTRRFFWKIILYMRVILLAITLLVGTLGYAQQKGKVLQADGQPVEGAFVRVLNTNLGTVTDANGSFSLELGAGRYDLLITAIGYAALDKSITVSVSGNEELSITLAESAIRLDDIVVTAEKEEGELQRVPYSISALSSRKVSEYRIWNSKDITAIVPNLYSANPGDNRNVTSIRGITSTSYDPADHQCR
jgi:iron complex outermembrane receptor protein